MRLRRKISRSITGARDTRIGSAGRNRPQGLGPDVPVPDPILDALSRGMDAERAGEIVRRAIEEDEFWIFTHPELQAAVDARQADIAGAFARWKERLA